MLTRRPGTIGGRLRVASSSRPVILATFDVPVRPDAAAFAVDSAVESGQPLLLVNVVDLPDPPYDASWGSEVVVLGDIERRSASRPSSPTHSRCASSGCV